MRQQRKSKAWREEREGNSVKSGAREEGREGKRAVHSRRGRRSPAAAPALPKQRADGALFRAPQHKTADGADKALRRRGGLRCATPLERCTPVESERDRAVERKWSGTEW